MALEHIPSKSYRVTITLIRDYYPNPAYYNGKMPSAEELQAEFSDIDPSLFADSSSVTSIVTVVENFSGDSPCQPATTTPDPEPLTSSPTASSESP